MKLLKNQRTSASSGDRLLALHGFPGNVSRH